MPITLVHPAVQRVLDVAARKGVTLEVMTFPDSTHTAADAARVVGAEIGQIVKSLVFVTTNEDGSLEPIVCLVSGADRRVKILARGELDKALTVRAHKFSGRAAEKIAAAGGTAEALA